MAREDWTNFSLERPNYFPGQYLLDEDFELEHKYLGDRQRYVNSKLHLSGIVEGLEVEAIAGQPEVIIKPGAAIDGAGNLIVVAEATTRPVYGSGWLCLRYHRDAKILQQPDIPDSFTRFLETPLLTLEAIETQDDKTVILAKLTLNLGQVSIDNQVRRYSGVRLPSAQSQEIALHSDGSALSIQGNLSLDGVLQLGHHSILSLISDSIDRTGDRTNVVPSEMAIKAYLEERILARLASLNIPTEEGSPIALILQPDGLYGWKIEGGDASDPSAQTRLISCRASVDTPRLVIERDTGKIGIGTMQPSQALDVQGNIRAHYVQSTNPMRHRMYPADPLVYQDIFEAKKAKAIQKYREPKRYDETKHGPGGQLWNDRSVILFGEQETDDAGALIKVPNGYNTVWVRVPGDRWYCIKAQFRDGQKEDLGYWSAGRREANCYCPDGSLSDGYAHVHQWVPIPVGRSGEVVLIDKYGAPSDSGLWFSGLGFSKNPWAHATQSAQGYYWAANTGDRTVWDTGKEGSNGWRGDVFTRIDAKMNLELMVPYIWSGRDKLLYLVEHNSDWNGCSHAQITVNGQPIERFQATYNNPFARHWNSKTNNRYIAARIPAVLIPKPTSDVPPLLKVRIDTSKQDKPIHLREMGTHDLEVPAPE